MLGKTKASFFAIEGGDCGGSNSSRTQVLNTTVFLWYGRSIECIMRGSSCVIASYGVRKSIRNLHFGDNPGDIFQLLIKHSYVARESAVLPPQ